MPPNRPPQRAGFFASMTGWLLKLKTFLNLLISDLLRVILAVFLFFVVLLITIGVISYRQWYPAVTDYLHALDSAPTSTTSPQ